MSPLDGAIVSGGELEVSGRAWSGKGRVISVKVTVDGATWTEAELGGVEAPWD